VSKNTRNFALAKFRSIYKNAEHFCREQEITFPVNRKIVQAILRE